MSETPDTPPSAAPPAPRNSPLAPPPPRRLDPAAVMIGVGGVVLLLAVWWLLVTPRSTSDASVDPARVAQLEQRLRSICDPEEVDARAKRRQQQQLERYGGRHAAIARGDLGFTPAPGVAASFD